MSEVEDEPWYAELMESTEPTMTPQEPSSSAIPQGHTTTSNAPTSKALSESHSQDYDAQPETIVLVNNPSYIYTQPKLK